MGLLNKLRGKGKKDKRPFCSAVVAAGGSSQRFGENKLFSLLDDVPVIAYTLINLDNCPDIDEIVIAAREEDIIPISNICKEYNIGKVTTVVLGGKTRAASVLAGMMECAAKAELIAVHDAARPFAAPELISRVVEEAALVGACAPAVPVIDTIKVCENQMIVDTPDRDKLFAVQTPQVFTAELIKAALISSLTQGKAVTDDCAAVELFGKPVHIVAGDYTNIKITTVEDLAIAQYMMESRVKQ